VIVEKIAEHCITT